MPAEPVTQTVKKRVSAFWHKLRRDKSDSDSPLKSEAELSRLPDWQIEQVAPASDWNDAAQALVNQLEDWLGQKKPSTPVIVLVGPPHSGLTSILNV